MTIDALQQVIDKMMRLIVDRQTDYDNRVLEIQHTNTTVDPEIEALILHIESFKGEVEQAQQTYKEKEALL